MKTPLPGKKTYIAAALTIAGYWGAHLSGNADLGETIRMTVEAVLAITIRLGIAASKSSN